MAAASAQAGQANLKQGETQWQQRCQSKASCFQTLTDEDFWKSWFGKIAICTVSYIIPEYTTNMYPEFFHLYNGLYHLGYQESLVLIHKKSRGNWFIRILKQKDARFLMLICSKKPPKDQRWSLADLKVSLKTLTSWVTNMCEPEAYQVRMRSDQHDTFPKIIFFWGCLSRQTSRMIEWIYWGHWLFSNFFFWCNDNFLEFGTEFFSIHPGYTCYS